MLSSSDSKKWETSSATFIKSFLSPLLCEDDRQPFAKYLAKRLTVTDIGFPSDTYWERSAGPTESAPPHVPREDLEKGIESLLPSDDASFDLNHYLRLWSTLPELVAASGIPEDMVSRLRQRADVATAVADALGSSKDFALLTFSLSPVQSFIEAARSLQDLWSGSSILSWLTFCGMEPVISQHGPGAIVFPNLRGIPLFDSWIAKKVATESAPNGNANRAASIPNRFLALVPRESSDELIELCKARCNGEWRCLASRVFDRVKKIRSNGVSDEQAWDSGLWWTQVEKFFEVTVSVLPCSQSTLRQFAAVIQPSDIESAYPSCLANRKQREEAASSGASPAEPLLDAWPAFVDIASRMHEASRSIRNRPASAPKREHYPPKCTLMGSFEQMGPADFDASAKFWKALGESRVGDKARIRKGDRLCAISLVKRFAMLDTELKTQLGILDVERFDDTAKIAAAHWKDRTELAWDKITNGQWLHWREQNEGEEDGEEGPKGDVWTSILKARNDNGPPPAYYAILFLDVDDMGKWLRGEAPISGNGSKGPRAVTPLIHTTISATLTRFAVNTSPSVVEECKGTLVYAGGDDLLAFLPTDKALECAQALQTAVQCFAKTSREVFSPTVSVGIAVCHYKEDLRLALQHAREAERIAKANGKDSLALRICRHSGNTSTVLSGWPILKEVTNLVEAFREVSCRWAYRLYAELPTLSGLPRDSICALIRQTVNHADEETRNRLAKDGMDAGEYVVSLYDAYHQFRESREDAAEAARLRRHEGRYLEDFLTLCESAAFLARGKSE